MVSIHAPSPNVLVGAQMQLSAGITDPAGTPLDTSGLGWSVSSSTLAAISSSGAIQGLMPGDVKVTAADSNSGASAMMMLHIVPGAITVQPSSVEVAAGSTTPLAAQALDIKGKAIAGVQFQYTSGDPGIAAVSVDGTVTGVAEGFVTLEARIAAASSDAALVATARVHVLPPPAYRLTKILSTETTETANVEAYTTVSSVSSSEIAVVAALSNGSQAGILLENGKQNVLAVTGQILPNAGRMVMSIQGISANSKGDVAMLIRYPSQWCSSSVILFPHGKSEIELAGQSQCYANLDPRALAEDGSVLVRNQDPNRTIFRIDSSGNQQVLFSLPTQPALKDPIANVNNLYPSRGGTFILETNTVSGAHQYFYYDGKNLTPLYKDGDVVAGSNTNNIGNITGSSDGTFYSGVYGSNYSALAQIAPGTPKFLLKSGTVVSGGAVSNGTSGWIQNIADASPAGVLMVCDITTSTFDRWLAVWSGGSLTAFGKTDSYGSMLAGSISSSGAVTATVQMSGDTTLPLRSFSVGNTPSVVLPAGKAFPQPVPVGIDWNYAARGATDSALLARGESDTVLSISSARQTVAAVGSPLPNGHLALTVGAVNANQSGDVLFTASFDTGSGLFRYHASSNKLETLADNSTAGPPGTNFTSANSWQNRYSALNSRGDAAAIVWNNANRVVFYGVNLWALIAQQNGPALASQWSGFQNVALDDNGHVIFIATTTDGHTAAYFWDGNAVSRVIGIGDPGLNSLPVNAIMNVAGAGSGFVLLTASGNYATNEMRYYDGAHLTVIQSSPATLLDGVGLSSFWSNECTLASNGDAHCMAATQDGGTGVYAHRQTGEDLIVARARDHFPGGEWLIMPLSISSTPSGAVFFTAYMWKNGSEFLALYRADRQ